VSTPKRPAGDLAAEPEALQIKEAACPLEISRRVGIGRGQPPGEVGTSRLDSGLASRKLLEIANATGPAQDGGIYIELVNAAFLKAGDGTLPTDRGAGRERVDPGHSFVNPFGGYTLVYAIQFQIGAVESNIRLSIGVDGAMPENK
jgi:hypothetical protein